MGQDEDGNVTLICPAVERGFIYPEEVSAQVLGQLLADVEEFTGSQVKKVSTLMLLCHGVVLVSGQATGKR